MIYYSEEQYPFLVNELIKVIEKTKKSGDDSSLIEIIMDYCFRNDIDLETAGDAISSDTYFKSFIEKDCQIKKIFKSQINMEVW